MEYMPRREAHPRPILPFLDLSSLKMISLSTQRFITSLVSEAQAHRVFNEGSDMQNNMLTTTELQYAFKTKGIKIEKPQYFVEERDQ